MGALKAVNSLRKKGGAGESLRATKNMREGSPLEKEEGREVDPSADFGRVGGAG